MMTRAEFRELVGLTWSTWEGSHIKAVQTALSGYHDARPDQRRAKLATLSAACIAWADRHLEPGDSDRSRGKTLGMERLFAEVENEVGWSRDAMDALPIAKGTRYRRDAENLNKQKEDIAIPQISVKRHAAGTMAETEHLICADARQTRQNLGRDVKYSDRTRTADLLSREVLDAWEGARRDVSAEPTITLARDVVRTVRRLLPLGPFNNQPGGGRPAVGSPLAYPGPVTSVGHGMQLVEAISEDLVHEVEDPDFLYLYAAVAAAAIAVGGGVCTHLMSVTAGVLTTVVPDDTEILMWFSSSDHQFCVISVAKGPWVLVDPWPLRSYATTWEDHCYFPQPSERTGRPARLADHAEKAAAARQRGRTVAELLEENYAKITVKTKCSRYAPYGVPGLVQAARVHLKRHIDADDVPAVEPGHPYVHEASVTATEQEMRDGAIPFKLAATPNEWGGACG